MPQIRSLAGTEALNGGCPYLRSLTEQNKEPRRTGGLQTWEVKDGASTLIRYRQAVQKTDGLITIEDINRWEGARDQQADDHPYCQTAIRTATSAIQAVRTLLPKGPLNNRGAMTAITCNTVRHWSSSPASDHARNLDLTAHLSDTGTPVGPSNKDHMLRLASFGAAARGNGCGVCTHIMALTMNYLSTAAPSGTEALGVYHKGDHQFCVISVHNCPWYVVDPWVLNSYVTRWDRPKTAYFAPEGGVLNYHKLTVVDGPTTLPLGVTIPGDPAELARTRAAHTPDDQTEMEKPFSHCCNLHTAKQHRWPGEKPVRCTGPSPRSAPADSEPVATWTQWGTGHFP